MAALLRFGPLMAVGLTTFLFTKGDKVTEEARNTAIVLGTVGILAVIFASRRN